MPPQTPMPIQRVSFGTGSHCTICSSVQTSHKAELYLAGLSMLLVWTTVQPIITS